MENIKIDVTHDFTSEDNHRFWNDFNIYDYKPFGLYDPDQISLTLCNYHKILWSKKLHERTDKKLNLTATVEWSNGQRNINEIKKEDEKYYFLGPNSSLFRKDYSCVLRDADNIAYSSDGMINAFLRYDENLKKELEKVEDEVKDFYRKSYTIGGMIIFPRRRYSINVARGNYKGKIKDRFDLTLECIRLYYENKKSPLFETLEKDDSFFKMFKDFKGYVDFFFLQDLVTPDYTGVINLMSKEKERLGEFVDNPLPKDLTEWRIWKTNSLDFIDKRNSKINEWAKDNNF